ncbi:MAG: FAD-binding oxidoreductase [Bdellovibrionales bacterium]|nr:FAD-binding oxidoreductase [Bdellovibrionales bacterium]
MDTINSSLIDRSPNIVERLAKIVGDENVLGQSEALQIESKLAIPFHTAPACIVRPTSAAQVQEIMALANATGSSVWVGSRGHNWGYGSKGALQSQSIILLLDRLDKIHEVDSELGYAVVEPGVTYRQLARYLDEHEIPLMVDPTDGPPDGSVLGNALDRGVGIARYSDHCASLCGLEVVLPSGAVVQTGGGLLDNCKTFHTYRWGIGPSLDGLFSQSNYGVVVKAGIWLRPKPEEMLTFSFQIRENEMLSPAIDALAKLSREGVLEGGTHMCNDICQFAIFSQLKDESSGELCSRLSIEGRQALRTKWDVPLFGVFGALYGRSEQLAAGRNILAQELGPYGRLEFFSKRKRRYIESVEKRLTDSPNGLFAKAMGRLSGKSVEVLRRHLRAAVEIEQLLQGKPSDYFVRHAYYRSPIQKPLLAKVPEDDIGLVWFAPIIPFRASDLSNVISLTEPLFDEHNFDYYLALLFQNARSMITLMAIFYDKHDPESNERAKLLLKQCTSAIQDAGYIEYRTSLLGASSAIPQGGAYAEVLRQLKAVFDPYGILSPGKYGIG